MIRAVEFTPSFVEFVPSELTEHTLYISMEYGTAVHRCACGCGEKVVTPFGRTDWKVTYDGETVSLYPSIGNWSFRCRSHYWIRENRIEWAPQWSDEEVAAGRVANLAAKQRQFARLRSKVLPLKVSTGGGQDARGGWASVKQWWSQLWT